MNRRALVLAFLLLAPARVRGLESETRHLDALNANVTTTWTDESNAFTEDDSYASASDSAAVGDYAGGSFQDIGYTPGGLGLTGFLIRFFDVGGEHVNDTHLLQIYNTHMSAWETLETFDSGNLLPTALTTKDYTSAMQATNRRF